METTQTNTVKISNNLIYKTNKIVGKKHIFVSIRLNDECKNGHQDFAITADIYETGKPKTDRYFISGGCCHDEIIKAFPEFKIFVDLHLCDYQGIPTYAAENGFYHLRNGFNNTKPEDSNFKIEFCEYYRISPDQFDALNTSRNQLQYALFLQNLGILDQWKEQADNAIQMIEGLTGTKFLVDSVKTQYHAPTPDQIAEEQAKEKAGYYTPQAQQERENEKINGKLIKLQAERDKEINKANNEFEVKKQVLMLGGSKALDNCIFYGHTQQLAFNWKGYDQISQDLINRITASIQLPEGVTIKNESKK